MKKFIFFLVLFFSVEACSRNQPLSYGPYHALKCGLKRKFPESSKFVFDKKNGSLYHFDLLTNTFKPLTRTVKEDIYLDSMEEYSSRLEGNNLVITKIDYSLMHHGEKEIFKITINLKSLVKSTFYKDQDGLKILVKENCMWIDPKLS